MRVYKIKFSQKIPANIDQLWEFMSSPYNLQLITPPDMGFKIVSDLTPETKMYSGQTITYTLTPLMGIRMQWVTEIKDVKQPEYFTDIQLKGPYKRWDHKHTFTPIEGGILMEDEVIYALPFGWLGTLFHGPLIKPRLEKIFRYRKKIIEEKFGTMK